jgi:hypothetical protein
VEPRLWSIKQEAQSDERWDSNPVMENHFRLSGIGESKLVCMGLYSNRWIFVNNIKTSAGGDLLREPEKYYGSIGLDPLW